MRTVGTGFAQIFALGNSRPNMANHDKTIPKKHLNGFTRFYRSAMLNINHSDINPVPISLTNIQFPGPGVGDESSLSLLDSLLGGLWFVSENFSGWPQWTQVAVLGKNELKMMIIDCNYNHLVINI